jgi:hypothetical protein
LPDHLLGTTIALIWHDMGVVMGISDRVVVPDYARKSPADRSSAPSNGALHSAPRLVSIKRLDSFGREGKNWGTAKRQCGGTAVIPDGG